MIVFRFIFFVLGIAVGFAAAIAALPLPGKTFFNRMSKLPPRARDLIDNGIDVGISFFKLASITFREFAHRTNLALEAAKEKVQEIRARYNESLSRIDDRDSVNLQIADEFRTEVEV